MKIKHLKSLLTAVVLILVVSALNMSVTTNRGVNYQIREIKLPLYLKILDFVDRDCNYRNILSNILSDAKDDNEKTVRIFNYVTSNVRKNPKELPVIDDHPLNILIRGYGVQDQFEDIFTILCTYAGMETFFQKFQNNSGKFYYMSFVKIGGRWRPLSAFGNAYVVKDGVIASVDDILLDKEFLAPFSSNLPNFESDTFLKEISNMDYKVWSVRTRGQSPVGRVLSMLRRAR